MRGIERYRTNRVESAPPTQVVLMLFQESVHRLTQAANDLSEGNSTEWRGHIHHVREIFFELLGGLDYDAAPEMCANLQRLYQWAINELILAGREQSADRITNVLKVTTTLLEGWQAVSNGNAENMTTTP